MKTRVDYGSLERLPRAERIEALELALQFERAAVEQESQEQRIAKALAEHFRDQKVIDGEMGGEWSHEGVAQEIERVLDAD